MAAELTYTNGVANIFTVRLPAWHHEGRVLTAAPTFDDALTLAGHDYPLEKMPYYMPGVAVAGQGGTPAAPSNWTEAGDAFYVWRPDTQKKLGSVGSSYEIVTNRQAFEVLRPLVDAGLFKLETGGTLRDGADAWLMGQWNLEKFGPIAREVLGGETNPYSAVMANHNGRRGILLGNTPVRIVCANTLGQAECSGVSRWETVDHRQGANVRLVEVAQKLFQGVVERYEVVAAHYRALKQTNLTLDQFRRLVLDVVAPDPTQSRKWNPEAKLAETVLARANRKRTAVAALWTDGAGHVGDFSAWEAYNAAVEAIDHNKELFPTRAGCYRTASLLDGELAARKNKVLDGLVAFATAA
jgi:phage/plasmid-like protein (TIGR03299 family)